MTEHDPEAPHRPRGWVSVYAVALALVVVSGASLLIAVRSFFESDGLLWVSIVLSGAAIVTAVAAIVLPARR